VRVHAGRRGQRRDERRARRVRSERSKEDAMLVGVAGRAAETAPPYGGCRAQRQHDEHEGRSLEARCKRSGGGAAAARGGAAQRMHLAGATSLNSHACQR
jgi:hypothetical protein